MQFRSDFDVNLVDKMGTDQSIVRAARVSVTSDDIGDVSRTEQAKLINYLLKHRHMSPFEHCQMTVRLDVPIFLAREFMRHRTFAFNETSARYRDLEPTFYVPPTGRPLQPTGSSARPTFAPGTDAQETASNAAHRAAYATAWSMYQKMLEEGIAREVARNVLPVGIYTQFYASANLRNWFHFLSLRTLRDDALVKSYVQWELDCVATQIEAIVEEGYPLAYKAFSENGRIV